MRTKQRKVWWRVTGFGNDCHFLARHAAGVGVDARQIRTVH